MMRAYYELTKPGIIYGNAITAAAGFFLASSGTPDVSRFLFLVVGLSCIVGSGSVYNNYIDRDIDRLMQRTKGRAFVVGRVREVPGLVYGALLGLTGIALLFFGTNLLATLIAVAGWIVYIGIYTPTKRVTPYALHLGALAGAVPPVVGYVAVTNRLDLGAVLIFVLLFFWQMPHFLAIAVRRADDYHAARIPVLALRSSARAIWLRVVIYICAFGAIAFLVGVAGYAGLSYLVAATTLSLWWLGTALAGHTSPDVAWASRVFRLSLIVLVSISILLGVDACAAPNALFCSGVL